MQTRNCERAVVIVAPRTIEKLVVLAKQRLLGPGV